MSSVLKYDQSKNDALKDDIKYDSESGMMLEDIVNTKFLDSIHERFIKITGMRCFITNTKVEPVTSMFHITNFCKLIRSTKEGRIRCAKSCRDISLKSRRKGEAISATCHAGLIYAVSPILVNNQHIGSFFCGQIVLPGEWLKADNILRNVEDLDLDRTLLLKYLDEVEIVSSEKLITALEMLTLMTNYITEMGAANIAQQQLMTEMKAKTELESLLRETEHKALQAQINPHFLFNCLSTISQIAFIEGANQTQELTYAISDILRSLLKNPQKIITLKEELKYVKDYLLIQQARFGDRINVIYSIEEEIVETKLPKFILQPIVENAVVHGLEPKIEGGSLTIDAHKENNNIVISVIDTGMGIQKAEMSAILNVQANILKTENLTGLGINNVQQRIKFYFGEDYGLNIKSKPGEGCKVTITIPVKSLWRRQDV
jgi:ligand-binding sensor protein